ncbi:MAG TPA: YicC/YloC family endoribonuclease [Planctomycetota bacterium]|nr:YicC/YloC family endoribonuclease [Planctomycetota bacterium]
MAGIASMTGFGRATREAGGETFEVEVRAVNNRSLKVLARLSETASSLAARVEQHVRERVERGTVYVTVKHRRVGGGSSYRLDEALLETYARKLRKVEKKLKGVSRFSLAEVAQLEGVVVSADALEGDLDAFWERLRVPLDEAIDQLIAMRKEEGKGITRDLLAIADRIAKLASSVEARVDAAVDDYRKKLKERIDKLLRGSGVPLPEADLARELALFADRSDISEELQRLRSHVAQLRSALATENGTVGRKLEFLAQELLREANTMASKSHDTQLVTSVLDLKLEVERVREQVANVE